MELIIYLILAFIFIYCVRTISKRINNRYRDDSRNIIILSDFCDLDTIGELPSNYQVLAYANNSDKHMYNAKPVVHNISEIRDFLSHHRVDEIYANLSSQTSLVEIFKIFEVLGIPTKINITPIIKEVGANTAVTFQGDNIYLTSANNCNTTPGNSEEGYGYSCFNSRNIINDYCRYNYTTNSENASTRTTYFYSNENRSKW